MAEYWMLVQKNGRPISWTCGTGKGHKSTIETADKLYPTAAPHGILPLVLPGPVEPEPPGGDCDAPGCRGDVPTDVYTVEPELAEVVREVIEAMREEESGEVYSDEEWLPCAVSQAARKLKPHQLRACGIEVPE